ncbi:glycoside hydrolase family 19 protein [Pseudomonas oryzihabitans]|uniref:glycoside hydrolase family 19 protein n=1 Tax=Pseudomonas oryzihabitans TaxID=47885 RepID=UPI00165DA9A0|nr:glycoside hydrolase family 19 protein [Pseudomonas psychrotolerans]
MIAARNEGGIRTSEQRWWHLKGLLADGEGRPIEGWLCEQEFITSRHSPWDFPDYELVKETTTYRAKLAYSLCANRQLTKVELSRFEIEIQQVQQSSLTTKISRILSPIAALRSSELTKNLINPWIFQKIGALVIQHESEWAWNTKKWDSLDVMMPAENNKKNCWEPQKEIIKNLSWWNAASTKIRELDADKCWHFNSERFFHYFIEKKKELITLAMLQIISPRHDNAYYEKVLPYLNKYANAFKVNTPIRIAHFLAQTGHESGFIVKSENGRYSARRMREMFGCKGGSKNYSKANDDCSFGRQRDRLWSEESKFVMNSEALLNFVYSSRMGNGDESSGDGYKYRGRGIIQLTGKDTYRRYTEIHNRANPDDLRDFVEQPDLITDSLQYGIESAFVYWDMANANKLADADNAIALSKAINGGLNGFKDRAECLEKIKSHLDIQK